MTEQDLLRWALEHYFSDWEIERAQATLEKEGMDAAVEFLRSLAADSWRGYSGPGHLSFETRNGRVELRLSGARLGDEPDLVYDLAKFCRWKLESLYQVRLL